MNESESQITLPSIPSDLVDAWLSQSTEVDTTLKARLAHIIVLSEDAIISINESQQITLFNPAAERMFGYQAHEVMGKPMSMLLPPRYIGMHHKHVEGFIHSPDVIRPMSQRGDIFGLRKNGAEFPAEASISKSNLGNEIMLVVRMRDITERKRSDAAMLAILNQTQELYEFSRQIGAVRTLDELLAALLSNRHLAGCNRAGILVFNTAWTDQQPPPLYVDLVAGVSKDARLPIPNLATQRYRLGTSWVTQSGIRNRPVFIGDVYTEPGLPEHARKALIELDVSSFALFPLKASGEWYGLLALQFASPGGVSADDVRHVEGLVDQSAVAIRNIRLFEAEASARKEAERANELRLRFLAMISHELRTPLTSIKGFITTLLAEDVTWDEASQRDFLGVANQEADKLTDMIDQLLDLSRLEAGMLNIHPARHTMSKIISTAMDQLLAVAPEHALEFNVPDNLPSVQADLQRITQVLTNLVSNAAKYSPPATTITVSAATLGAFVQVNVSDQGPGIPAADKQRVFEAFQRGDGLQTRRTKGAGLGLAICKGIVEAHGGHIWVQEREGPGAVITFTLPIT